MNRWGSSIIVFILSTTLSAQQVDDVHSMVAGLLEPLAEKGLLQEDYSELIDDLSFLYDHPLNLNNVKKRDLERLPFLSDYQIENLLFYIYNNGPLLTIFELNAVEGLNLNTIKKIIPFLTVDPSIKKQPKANITGDIMVRGQMVLQKPSGYMPGDSAPPKYAGTRERLYARTRLEYGDNLAAGITLEKDPGEPMFNNQIPVTDFISGYILYRPKGFFRKIIIGDYQASFGQGVGLWTGFAFSKGVEAHQIRRRGKGIDKYSSVSETSYFRGGAFEMGIKKFQFHAFGSYKKQDGTVSDSSGISSIRDNGYHRTMNELLYRKNISETVFGGVFSYQSKSLRLEAGQTYWHIDQPIVRGKAYYQKFNFSGDELSTSFINYSWFGPKLILFGEFGWQNFNSGAFYQGLTYSPGADIRMAFSYRNYGKSYFTIYSNPFSESSSLNGENGIYLGLSCLPFKNLDVSTYIDVYWYEWLKYKSDAPSSGIEYLLQARYNFAKNISFLFRLKSNEREQNMLFSTGTEIPLARQKIHSVRGQLNYQPATDWWFQTRIEQLFFNEVAGHQSTGFLIYQDVRHAFMKKRMTVGVRILHFDTEDYYSRIYTWEPDILHAFSIPSFSGNGVRWLLNISYKVNNKLKFWCRLSNTHIPGALQMGSGYNTIEGDANTEIKLQLKYRF